MGNNKDPLCKHLQVILRKISGTNLTYLIDPTKPLSVLTKDRKAFLFIVDKM